MENGPHSTLHLMLSPRGSYLPPWMHNIELKQSHLTKTLSLTSLPSGSSEPPSCPGLYLGSLSSLSLPILVLAQILPSQCRQILNWISDQVPHPTSDAEVLDLPPPRTLQPLRLPLVIFHPLIGPTTQRVPWLLKSSFALVAFRVEPEPSPLL